MPKKADLQPGVQFNRLIIVSKNIKTGSTGKSYYDCKCTCGNSVTVSRSDLKTNNVKSCGCLRRELPTTAFKLEAGEVSYRILYSRCKRGAQVRGIEFTLTPQEHRDIIKQNCDYCGRPPAPFNAYNYKQQANMTTTAVKEAWIVANGVDRVDPKQGYTNTNCTAACPKCNYGKLDWTKEEYIEHCRQVVKHNGGKK